MHFSYYAGEFGCLFKPKFINRTMKYSMNNAIKISVYLFMASLLGRHSCITKPLCESIDLFLRECHSALFLLWTRQFLVTCFCCFVSMRTEVFNIVGGTRPYVSLYRCYNEIARVYAIVTFSRFLV